MIRAKSDIENDERTGRIHEPIELAILSGSQQLKLSQQTSVYISNQQWIAPHQPQKKSSNFTFPACSNVLQTKNNQHMECLSSIIQLKQDKTKMIDFKELAHVITEAVKSAMAGS